MYSAVSACTSSLLSKSIIEKMSYANMKLFKKCEHKKNLMATADGRHYGGEDTSRNNGYSAIPLLFPWILLYLLSFYFNRFTL